MGETTAIAWTDATWNPGQGCRKVNEDCRGCYMYRDMKRYGKDPLHVHRSAPHTFNMPLRLKRPSRIFVCSWSDFFLPEHDAWRAEAWAIIRRTPQHTYQIPTKRPERIRECLPPDWGAGWPNVWLGASAGHQKAWDTFVPMLVELPAAVRWVSVEPQWGVITPTADQLRALSWVVVGGESGGAEARAFDLEWARLWIARGRGFGFATFIKQLGAVAAVDYHGVDRAWYGARSQLGGVLEERRPFLDSAGQPPPGTLIRVRLADRSGANPAEWPEDLRVREFPEVRRG